jgi:hypothetical protein
VGQKLLVTETLFVGNVLPFVGNPYVVPGRLYDMALGRIVGRMNRPTIAY